MDTKNAYTNTMNPERGEGSDITSAQSGEGAKAAEDAVHIGAELIDGPVEQPVRGQAPWQGLGKGATWDESTLASDNGEKTSGGTGTMSTAGAWGMDVYDLNKGHTVGKGGYERKKVD